jgi:hypothetical protein
MKYCKARQNVRTKMLLDSNGIFEWDVIIEKACLNAWVEVCSSRILIMKSGQGFNLLDG